MNEETITGETEWSLVVQFKEMKHALRGFFKDRVFVWPFHKLDQRSNDIVSLIVQCEITDSKKQRHKFKSDDRYLIGLIGQAFSQSLERINTQRVASEGLQKTYHILNNCNGYSALSLVKTILAERDHIQLYIKTQKMLETLFPYDHVGIILNDVKKDQLYMFNSSALEAREDSDEKLNCYEIRDEHKIIIPNRGGLT